MADKEKTEKYATISLPSAIMKAVDQLINDLGYWPSRGAFVREACLEKIHRERRRLKDLKDTDEDDDV
ncbi:ribbon-helix-helix protein, CopG family [Candidatus Bathyarchaeota archaeon]|nr:ribbon-helix-helix protein, CopG family [Candidatus Bathyarchaeota archaeon]